MSYKSIAAAMFLGVFVLFGSGTHAKATVVSFNVDFFRDNGFPIGGGTLSGMISFDDTVQNGLVTLIDAIFVFDANFDAFDTVWTLDESDFPDVELLGGEPFEFIGNVYTDSDDTNRKLFLSPGNGLIGGDWRIEGIGTPDTDGIYSFSAKSEVSEPAVLALLGAGLFGLAVVRKRRSRVR